MMKGAFTALVTPFVDNQIDLEGLNQLIEFQVSNGITGILAAGTTGESPTLNWTEHNLVIETVIQKTPKPLFSIAGTGSNNTKEAMTATRHAVEKGADAILLVDPYYNGPSSLEIRRAYIGPIAAEFPDIPLIPYVIPGRTGTQLLPEDLAILNQEHHNVSTVKEATGNLDNMRRTRQCCGEQFTILSGDDALTYTMMTDSSIGAAGVVSVFSNIVPKAVSQMVARLNEGQLAEAKKLADVLAPLFDLVAFKTTETSPFGPVSCRCRNPLAVKTLMAILGMPGGGCRPPMGKMTSNALEKMMAAARNVQRTDPRIFEPVANFFNVDIEERLNSTELHAQLAYPTY
jgi:4-hydroxy-tetrahydrodipicolinate synthase